MSTEITKHPQNTRPQAGTPAGIVHAYLSAMEARDLILAKEFLAGGFTMTFPGNNIFTTLDQLVTWGKGRYRFVKKTFENFDEIIEPDKAIVYCFGTLYGETLDGKQFSGIRFIDRFSIQGEKLTDQLVWNDMATTFLSSEAGNT